MEKVANLSKKIISSTKNIPEKKGYIEFFTAVLSVPVLITVIMLNINNLTGSNKSNIVTPPPPQKTEKVYIPITANTQNASKNLTPEVSITPQTISSASSNQACKPEIGPVSISSPSEGDIITESPAYLIISYKAGGQYCAVVWSYRLNNGAWSGYDDKSIALYNLPQDKIKIDVKVKSIVTGEEQILTRNFTYNGATSSITPIIPPTILPDINNSSSSAVKS